MKPIKKRTLLCVVKINSVPKSFSECILLYVSFVLPTNLQFSVRFGGNVTYSY